MIIGALVFGVYMSPMGKAALRSFQIFFVESPQATIESELSNKKIGYVLHGTSTIDQKRQLLSFAVGSASATSSTAISFCKAEPKVIKTQYEGRAYFKNEEDASVVLRFPTVGEKTLPAHGMLTLKVKDMMSVPPRFGSITVLGFGCGTTSSAGFIVVSE